MKSEERVRMFEPEHAFPPNHYFVVIRVPSLCRKLKKVAAVRCSAMPVLGD